MVKAYYIFEYSTYMNSLELARLLFTLIYLNK